MNKRMLNISNGLLKTILALMSLLFMTGCSITNKNLDNQFFEISWASSSVDSWRYTIKKTGKYVDIRFPEFEIDGKEISVVLNRLVEVGMPENLRNGVTEYNFEGAFRDDTTLKLKIKFRIACDNPVVRFCYSLKASGGQKLTKNSGADKLVYLNYSLEGLYQSKEIRFSVFNGMIHSCNLKEVRLYDSDFKNSDSATGPVFLCNNNYNTFLCAYEHDSMYPGNFLEFKLQPGRIVKLCAIRGNYYSGQPVDGYSTVWLELAGAAGDEEAMAKMYRTFILKYQSENTESRKPYLYYNTWGRQERVKWAGGRYLSSMNLDYTLKEIDRAHDMGIEVYVLDAGWFDKTGDWGVNLKNFPDGFKQIREKIKGYGMKLGVWMNPVKAAVSSTALLENKNCLKTWNGNPSTPSPEWETEESTNMCLVSPYWEHYAGVLIGLYKELDIKYFYLDGVGQTGCNDPGHFHGTDNNTAEERHQCYGFLLPVYLGKIMDKVSKSCPGVIFDFDVTESDRIGVGLQFLASGRYFILNNGPYFRNFDLGESLLQNENHNIFVQPGPARTWFMRSVLDYDKWIPSNLFLANYQPDDPESSQIINLASLVLGQNSVWGEILKTSPDGVTTIHDILEKYKQVRNDVAMASPVRIGSSGDTPEIWEKINPETGKGVVVIFSNSDGHFSYITRNKVSADLWHNKGATVKIINDGYAEINTEFGEASAAIVFFGVDQK
ncbi:MAG TPA: alpha-galactosidase [Bacteroidales bacterium]|nr:alpha-galactosidase [Bacteroidales bacterium]HPT20774.1 alpha-galactosidase [Bacteroidales bacterium]